MADERDEKLAAAYRALGAEEPPRALDEAILAAARNPQAGWRRPGVKPGMQRWAVPLSLAAVLVLSVTVTLRVRHEAPGIESPVAMREQVAKAEAPAAAEPDGTLKLKQADRMGEFTSREPALRAKPKPFADAPRDASPPAKAAAAAPPPASAAQGRLEEYAARADLGRSAESSVAGAAARQTEERIARDAEAAARAPQVGPLQALAKRNQAAADVASPAPAAASPPPAPAPAPAARAASVAAATPALELERIAALRAEGRHDEADKAFLEFRRRYPDFKITEDMLRRVERR